jgi:segregation and condensation protein A
MIERVDKFEEDTGRPEVAPGEELVIDVAGFEGPIDVLLTLARDQKVDITQISILALAEQYLVWVSRVRAHNLELAADYLVMAAWLAYLKSRLLLPPETTNAEEPTGEMMAEALAYQMRRLEAMQTAGQNLILLPQLGKDYFRRGAPESFGYTSTTKYNVTLYDLLSAYGDQARRSNIRTLRVAPTELYSMDEAIQRLTSMLGKMPDWSNLMQFLPVEMRGDLVSRSALAATFLAALQMTKEGRLRIRQGETFGPVYIRAANELEVAASNSTEEIR